MEGDADQLANGSITDLRGAGIAATALAWQVPSLSPLGLLVLLALAPWQHRTA